MKIKMSTKLNILQNDLNVDTTLLHSHDDITCFFSNKKEHQAKTNRQFRQKFVLSYQL